MLKWTFTEWLNRRLDESMTLYIQDYERPASMHRLGEIARMLETRVVAPLEKKLPPDAEAKAKSARPGYETVSADDLKDDQAEGDLNFYCYGWPRPLIDKALSGIRYFLDEIGVKYGPFREETWRHKFDVERDKYRQWGDEEADPDYPDEVPQTWQQRYDGWMANHADMQHDEVRVVRIPILSNANRRPDQPEDINLANDNATAIFGSVLGFPGDASGFHDIDVNELIMRIDSYLGDHDVERGVRPPEDGRGAGGARFVDRGLDAEGINRRLDRILAFARWAKDAGYDRLYVA